MFAPASISLDDLDPALIAATVQQAERQATMVAVCLDAIDARLKEAGHPEGSKGLPLGFLLELGSICQLKYWEISGLRDFLPPGLPTSEDASTDLYKRATTTAPEEFYSIENDHLGRQLLAVWLERFAWAAPNLLQADVVLGEVDEDSLVDGLARLLWVHRNDPASEGDHGN